MSNKKLPNFVIAGFPKCGSTSLFYYLNEHPEIFMPKQKELHYFTYKILSNTTAGPGDKEVNKFHVDNYEDYKKNYSNIKDEKAIGDASPSYLNYPSCIPKIKEKLGHKVKIIVLLRDPLRRTQSNYLHLVRENRETLDFFEALHKEDERKEKKYSDFWYYTFNSFYYHKIKEFKQEFDDVLIITTEELSKNTSETLKAVYSFLNVDNSFVPPNIGRRYNPGGVFKKNYITKFFFKQSKTRSLIKHILPITPWMKHIKHNLINKYQEPTPSIDERAENYLVNLFKEDVSKLKNEYGVKTDLWNSKFVDN